MRAHRLGLFLAVLAATSSSPASAGTATVTDGLLEYVAASGEINSVTITRSPDAFRITDLGAVVTPGTGCSSVTPNQVECPARSVERLFVNAGDLNDFVTVSSSVRTRVRGGGGDDILEGGEGDDDLIGNSGTDTLKGGTGIDAFYPGLGADIVSGGTGVAGDEFEPFDIDLVFYWWRDNPVTVSLDDLPNDGELGEGDNVLSDVEVVIGGAAGDTLIGNDLEINALAGGPGDDDLRGGGGEFDILVGGFGRDLLRGAAGFDALFAGPDPDNMFGGNGGDLLRGGGGNDFVRGQAESDLLFGGRGNDTLVGGLGRDALFSCDGRYDEVFGSAGRDRARVDRGLDRVRSVESVNACGSDDPALAGRHAAAAAQRGGVVVTRVLRVIEAHTR